MKMAIASAFGIRLCCLLLLMLLLPLLLMSLLSCDVQSMFFLSFLFLACNNIKDFGLCVYVCENHIIHADKRLCYGTFAHTTPRTPFLLSEWKKQTQQEWVRKRMNVKTIENSKSVRKTAFSWVQHQKDNTAVWPRCSDLLYFMTVWKFHSLIRIWLKWNRWNSAREKREGKENDTSQH